MDPRIYVALVDGNIPNTYEGLGSTELSETRLDVDSLRRIGHQLITLAGDLLAPAFQIDVPQLNSLGHHHLGDRRSHTLVHVDGVEVGSNTMSHPLAIAIRYIAQTIETADPGYLQGHNTPGGRVVGIKVIWRNGSLIQLTLCRNASRLRRRAPRTKVASQNMALSTS